jgi:hypothetical protein
VARQVMGRQRPGVADGSLRLSLGRGASADHQLGLGLKIGAQFLLTCEATRRLRWCPPWRGSAGTGDRRALWRDHARAAGPVRSAPVPRQAGCGDRVSRISLSLPRPRRAGGARAVVRGARRPRVPGPPDPAARLWERPVRTWDEGDRFAAALRTALAEASAHRPRTRNPPGVERRTEKFLWLPADGEPHLESVLIPDRSGAPCAHLIASGVRPRLHLLRDRPHGIPPQSLRRRDHESGAQLVLRDPPRALRQRGLHGVWRAAAQLAAVDTALSIPQSPRGPGIGRAISRSRPSASLAPARAARQRPEQFRRLHCTRPRRRCGSS